MTTFQVIRPFDPWKGPLCTCPPKFTLNPYTGCSHMCLYCYATSYIGRRRSTPKKDLINKVRRDLLKLSKNVLINMSTSSDPYPPEEKELNITREVLKLLSRHDIRLLITTKSNIIVRDVDILKDMKCAVMITITTLDENLAGKIEPNAPSPRDRVRALEVLTQEGIPVGVRIDPVIPFLNDDPAAIRELISELASIGVRHITTSTYKVKPDNFKRMIEAFPELEQKWRKLYFQDGEFIHGYRYLPVDVRKKILKVVIEEASKRGMTYATCREGLPEFRNAPSCDGSHLIIA